ncbi:efflux transporter outer membrane subunit [Pseudomonas entomophila]|uniref:efflux transporter outer membrane subunit n=1 Tax=Pseudomonas entomophila TaxID=312306 RepID=UPI0015E29E92|nr:efflux transporter outer membrane subunit [Pseudomonas entomophila]MBA1190160.1 efflux transporter outer membrane subunit [Pseudomonas entomophila]
MPRRLIGALPALSVCVLALTLTGCLSTAGIAPRSKAPTAETLDTDAAIREAVREAGWPAQQWWRAFGDTQLDHWVTLALAGSPSLALAAARVREAKALAGVVEADEHLQGTAQSTLKRHAWPEDQFYGPGALSGADTWDNQANLGLSYALDLWGRERNASEQALDQAHVRVAEARQAELELQNTVVKTYIGLSLQFARRDIVSDELHQQEQIVALAERRLAAGIGTEFELSQAQAPLPETHRQLDALDEAIALARNQLAALAGQGPGAGASLTRPHLNLGAPIGLPSALPAQLLGQRPDVVARRWQVAAQARGLDVAQADFLPNVDLVAGLGFVATGGGALSFLQGRKFNYSVGPALSLPVFDGGRLRARLGVAAAGYDEAVAQYDQTLVNALRQVSDQLIRRHSLDVQARLAAESVATARKTFDIATLAFERGLTGYLEVLNAQTLLFRQQQIERQVQAARLVAQAELVTALGGGVQAGRDVPGAQQQAIPPVPPALAVFERRAAAR